MPGQPITLDELRKYVGKQVRYQDLRHQVVEVIDDGPSLVLKPCTDPTVIQTNRYGEATRKAPDLLTIPVLTADRAALNPLFLEIEMI